MIKDLVLFLRADLDRPEDKHSNLLKFLAKKEQPFHRLLSSLESGLAINEYYLTDERCLLLKYLAGESLKSMQVLRNHWRFSQRIHGAKSN